MSENEKLENLFYEEEYISLFRERPWILRYLKISEKEKLNILKKAVKEKKRIEIEK